MVRGEFSCLVYYEDTDFTGFVYHASYLKFCERAREHLLGIERLRDLFSRGIHFVVHHLDATFHAPAKHADALTVRSEVTLDAKPRLTFIQEIWRADMDGQARKLFSTHIDIAVLNHENRPVRLPDWAIALLMARH